MKIITFFLLLPLMWFGQTIPQYYSGVDFTQSKDNVKQQLTYLITSTHHQIGYNMVWNVLDRSDEDPENSKNVLLIYGYDNIPASMQERSRDKTKKAQSGTLTDKWNREHVFCKSLASPILIGTGSTIDAGSDAHNLRPIDGRWNSTRNNRPYEDAQGLSRILASGNWYPGDEWKGDVARIIMYMYVRWGARTLPSKIAMGGNALYQIPDVPDVVLKWNREDPPSAFEIRRNNEIYYTQTNRNPFIDNPYLATLIWGGDKAQDTWGISNVLGTDNYLLEEKVAIVPALSNKGELLKIVSAGVKDIEIYNMLGQQVYAKHGKIIEFNAPKNSGVYIVRIFLESNNKSIVKQIIVK